MCEPESQGLEKFKSQEQENENFIRWTTEKILWHISKTATGEIL